MAKRSIRWPLDLENGRVQYTDDPSDPSADRGEELRQVIRLRLFPGTSANAWNDNLGTADQTFKPMTARSDGEIRASVKAHFATLERRRRAKLATLTITRPNPSTRLVAIEYDDLEMGGRGRLEQEVTIGGAA